MQFRPSYALLLTAVAAATAACAQVPFQDVNPRHGNLVAAQQEIRQAYDRLSDAQEANGSHLGGHAARAKELLREASNEIALAGEELDRRR